MKYLKKNVCLLLLSLVGLGTKADEHPLKLHYDRPAEYFEEALVIGNGQMGAIVYGGVAEEVLSLNDLTLWTGEPDRKVHSPEAHKAIPEIREALDKEDYRKATHLYKKVQGHYSENYQPLGTLTIKHVDEEYGKGVSGYERCLDISTALAKTSYVKDGKGVTAEYFASAPDSVIVVRLTSATEKGIHATVSFDSQLPYSAMAEGDAIAATGYAAYHSKDKNLSEWKDLECEDEEGGSEK